MMYHVSFKGRRAGAHFKPLRRIAVVLECDSIYNVKAKVMRSYEFVTSVCVTNCEWIGRELYEVAS